MNSKYKKILTFLGTIGPGLFLVGYNIGTGSITTMASAGAAHGMMLTWAILLSCVFTYILIVAFGRFTLVTGQTALQSFKLHFGKAPAMFVLITLIFTEMVSSVGVMAIVTDVIREWSVPLTESGEGFNTIILTILLGGLVVALLFNGKFNFIEKVLTLFVMLMGLCFLATSFMVIPDAGAVITGLIPSIPEEANSGLIIAGMIGTTMGGILYVTRSVTVKEKGWGIKDIKLEKRDAMVSSGLMFFLSIAVMASAAGTLHPQGLRVENAIDMIKLLEPLAGRFAISIFVSGIVCAGLSSLFPHYMLVPMLLSDYKNEKLNMKSMRNKGIILFYAALGLIVPIFGGRPVLVMIISQAFALIITPMILVLMIILLNKSDLMGKYKAKLWLNVVMGLITIFTTVMAVIGILGIIEIA